MNRNLPIVPRGSLIFTSGSPENLLTTFAPVGILENDIAHYENVDPDKNMENMDPEKIEVRIASENPKNLENLMNP